MLSWIGLIHRIKIDLTGLDHYIEIPSNLLTMIHRYTLFVLLLGGLISACTSRSHFSAKTTRFDLLIKNGRVVDGTGNPWYVADIAVKRGRIVRIDPHIEGKAKKVIDARNRIVCPGFIDVHGHAENVYQNSSERFTRMGVTTLITGNCGSSVTKVDSFLKQIRKTPVALNIATLVGHNSVRRKVMGEANRAPTPQELGQMKVIVEKGMRDGAVGLSTGLIYVPGTYATTDEVLALAKVASLAGGVYASHIRNEAGALLEAVREAIHIGREARMPVEISHFKVSSKAMWGSSPQSIQLVREARQQGLPVTVDQYVYTASSTRLSSIIPSWALAGGSVEAKKRIEHPDTLVRIIEAMKQNLLSGGSESYDYAVVANYKTDTTLNGKSILQITGQVKGKVDLDSQIAQILEMYLKGDAQMVYHSMNEQDVERILAEPFTMIASDAGPGEYRSGVPHPRGYGNNARVLGRYVREKKLIPLEDAIRKMTSLPAQTFGLKERGLLMEGFASDILIVDENTVTDNATFDKPHQYATGIDYVIVNGLLVIEHGAHTGALPGQAIRNK